MLCLHIPTAVQDGSCGSADLEPPQAPEPSRLCVLAKLCICISGLKCFRRYRTYSREGHDGDLVGNGLIERTIGGAEQLRESALVQKVIGYVSKGAIATLFVMVPYILWPF